jgi:hypothetical protein
MPHDKTVKVWLFNELDDHAKERAREWYRQGAFDYEWWEFVYDDAEQCAKCLGIEIAHRQARNGKGEPIKGRLTIYFSGFSSQGDGACFEGDYRYKKGWRKALKAHAPQDKELLEIGQVLQAAQKPSRWTATASIRNAGRYHDMSVLVNAEYPNVDTARNDEVCEIRQSMIEQCMKDFAHWIYKRLESEYDYMNSDEQVDEAIKANEYEFTEAGRRA